ncbi:MAG TPA: 4-vinyl reductase [bacterium]|nr:4-vinyl reductase [bacterium]
MQASSNVRIKVLTWLMEFLERRPFIITPLLRLIANAPFISKKLMVLPRAFMGATAFEIHDVDRENGRIGIGGVEEIMAGSKIIHLLHTALAERMGDEKKNEALYDMGMNLCKWEVSQALEHGRWAPAVLVPLIFNGRILDDIQTDPVMRRFFQSVMNMMSRLITDEGGWGRLEFDFDSLPLRVILSNSQEARWLGKSEKPVCHFYAGIVAGYASTISGEPFESREIACKAAGQPHCIFELHRLASRSSDV